MLKKGFTLVELIMVVALIALISLIAVPNITSMLKKMNDEKYQRFLSDVFLATEVYIQKNIDDYPTIVEQNEKVYVYMTDLISSSYLKSSLYDPKNKKFVKDEDYTVEVYLNNDNEYSYTLLEEHYIPCSVAIGTEYLFDYTGTSQEFSAVCDGNYKLEVWGAGSYLSAGAYTSGEIHLNDGNTFYIYVGKAGFNCTPYTSCAGSYNGGGAGGYFTVSDYQYRSHSGGGATDIRTVSGAWNLLDSLKSRIMVAAGSGACTIGTCSGGGLIGYKGSDWNNGTGGTQTSGGTSSSNAGSFGKGGNGYISNPTCAYGNDGYGAGSGYYGGGGGYGGLCYSTPNQYGSGGGGSSYISGHTGCVAITSATDVTPKTGCTTGATDNSCSIHYSGLTFTNTVMVDGNGYNWTNIKGALTNMPKKDGTGTMKGNGNNGYAKITYLGN